MMTIEDLKEEIHNNLQNVDYEERSNYGIIDAISDAFIKYEAINKNSVIPDVVQQSEPFYCKSGQEDVRGLKCVYPCGNNGKCKFLQ